uniref:Uncharacterized protein n=1 Tax=Panagrolaimus sp. JU765 TaxID=591449 RepID=A0AC34QUJ6_9BILA
MAGFVLVSTTCFTKRFVLLTLFVYSPVVAVLADSHEFEEYPKPVTENNTMIVLNPPSPTVLPDHVHDAEPNPIKPDGMNTQDSPNGEAKRTPAPINSTPDHDQPKEGSGSPRNNSTPDHDQPKEGNGIPQNYPNGAKMPAICHSLVMIVVVLVTIVKIQTIFHFKQQV